MYKIASGYKFLLSKTINQLLTRLGPESFRNADGPSITSSSLSESEARQQEQRLNA